MILVVLWLKPIKLALNGKEINLTSDDINIKSKNFNVDKDGNMSCNNADINGKVTSKEGNIGGWTVDEKGLTNGAVHVNSDGSSTVYTVADLIVMRGYINGTPGFELSSAMIQHYDLNGDGVVNTLDYVRLQNLIGISMN